MSSLHQGNFLLTKAWGEEKRITVVSPSAGRDLIFKKVAF
jgi:hypothetical protein